MSCVMNTSIDLNMDMTNDDDVDVNNNNNNLYDHNEIESTKSITMEEFQQVVIETEEEEDQEITLHQPSTSSSFQLSSISLPPEYKKWLDWKVHTRREIDRATTAGRVLGQNGCMKLMEEMLLSGIDIYFHIMVSMMNIAQEAHQNEIFNITGTFIKSFLDVMKVDVFMAIVSRMKDFVVTVPKLSPTDTEHTNKLSNMVSNLFTRQSDKETWALLTKHVKDQNSKRVITLYFQLFLNTCLSNKCIFSANFLLIYYQYILDIIALIDLDKDVHMANIMESVVMENCYGVFSNMTSAPFKIEETITNELNATRIRNGPQNLQIEQQPSTSTSTCGIQ